MSAQIRTAATAGTLGEISDDSPGMKGLVSATSGGSSGKPTLYFYTTKPRKGDNAADKCVAIEEEILFSVEPKNSKPRESSSFDFRAALAARHFNVVRVDVTEATTGLAKAPLIVLTDSKGEVKQQLAGGSITASRLYGAMVSVMKDEGKDIAKPVTKASAILSKLYVIECNLNKAKARNGRTAKMQVDELTTIKSQGQEAFAAAMADLNI